MTDQPATPNPSPSRGYAQPQSSTYTEFEQEKTTDNNASLKPFPGLAPQPSFQYSASLHPLDTTFNVHPTIASPHAPTPQSAGLRLQTDQLAERKREESTSSVNNIPTEDLEQTHFNAGLPVRTSSIRSVYGRRHRADSLSPSSALSSPAVGPLADMTPLPSPISAWGSPGFSRRSIDSEASDITPIAEQDPDIPIEPIEFASTSPKKRKIPLVARDIIGRETQIYNASAFSKNRSVSEYVPEGVQIPRSRNIVVSTSGASPIASGLSPPDNHMQREQYLAIQRGLAIPIPKPPTPPDSNRGADSGELESPRMTPEIAKGPVPLLYEAYKVHGGNLRRWRALRQLGKGTFSNVMLATSEGVNGLRDPDSLQHNEDGIDRKSLVAVKICEQGPAGGVDERKIEVSIKRELEIMKSINHPSLVQLKAVNICERQAFLVLNYCPGGDLFELASLKLDLVTPSLIQRIFSELVAAVRYLHLQYIVHRDIKLENVLVNLPTIALSTISNWQTFPHPVVTLTDLGLGRWIPPPPASPLLDTRCGSEDYAAPEVLIGQEYDGRATDAWALGVLLYAIMEGRLPFDPVPGGRRKSPPSHRIARCEWQWVRWANADGEWDSGKGDELEGGREVVEGLLARARSRWSLEKVQEREWVMDGIQVEGGLRREEEEDEENEED